MSIEDFIIKNITKNVFEKGNNTVPFPTFRKKFKKNQIITRLGEVERKAYLLITGIIQCSIQKEGEEKIIDFIFPNDFICAYHSFILNIPSKIELTALVDCEVEYLLKTDLKKAYESSIIANKFARYLKERVLLEKLNRESDFLTNTAEENYLELVKKRPEVIKAIPGNKIAKYLGIHPESLSRIRAKIIS